MKKLIMKQFWNAINIFEILLTIYAKYFQYRDQPFSGWGKRSANSSLECIGYRLFSAPAFILNTETQIMFKVDDNVVNLIILNVSYIKDR